MTLDSRKDNAEVCKYGSTVTRYVYKKVKIKQ